MRTINSLYLSTFCCVRSLTLRDPISGRVYERRRIKRETIQWTSDRETPNNAILRQSKSLIRNGGTRPAWNKMAEEKGASFRMNNIPAPYTEIQPDDGDKRSILAMENLSLHGYRDAAKKKKGLSLAYAKAALEEIARFHAMGYSYMMSYPGGLEEAKKANDIFITDFVNVRPTPAGVNMARSMVTGAAGILELIQEPGQDFVGIYNRFLEENDPVEYCRKIFSPNPDGFNVIGHGDLWFNNMLFKHDTDGNPTKVVLLDVSICRWCSPCVDLAYFLYTSTTPLLRATHFEDLLGYYHDTLVRCLTELGQDPAVYPYRQLKKDFDKYAFVGIFIGCLALPMVLAKKEDLVGQDIFAGDMADAEVAESLVQGNKAKMAKAIRNEPQIKIMLGGTFLDMIKRGVFNA